MKHHQVHPFAERFPILPEDQLQDLADSIAKNGLRYPIVLDKEGLLLDGRNRLAACKLAGIEPNFETLVEPDFITKEDREIYILDYILDVNSIRRHIPQSTQAMAYALAHPTPTPPQERNLSGRKGKKEYVSPEHILREAVSHARTVIREFGPDHDLVNQVMNGGSLREAYQAALKKKQEREDLKKALEELKLTKEQIIAVKPIEIQTNLDASLSDNHVDFDIVGLPKLDTVKQQQQVLEFISGITNKLRDESEKFVPPSIIAWDRDEFVRVIRSGVNKIIGYATKLADNYNQTLSQSVIKRVK